MARSIARLDHEQEHAEESKDRTKAALGLLSLLPKSVLKTGPKLVRHVIDQPKWMTGLGQKALPLLLAAPLLTGCSVVVANVQGCGANLLAQGDMGMMTERPVSVALKTEACQSATPLLVRPEVVRPEVYIPPVVGEPAAKPKIRGE